MAAPDPEVVVVGAGFAGLTAALVLGRSQRRVLVLGSGPTRNAEAEHAHNVLTREATPPGELLRLGRAEVAALPSVTLADAEVTAVESADDVRWGVRTADGERVEAPAVLLATGARDTLPDVAGLAALWGRRAHSCPFCDADPYAGRRLLALADEAKAAHSRALLAGWTDQVTVVDPAAVTSIAERDGEVVAALADGTRVAADGVFVGVTPVPRLGPVAALPLARRGPFLAVDGQQRTGLPGLWAAGDCSWRDGDASPGGQVVAAMAAGSRAAIAIVFDRLGVAVPDAPPVTATVPSP